MGQYRDDNHREDASHCIVNKTTNSNLNRPKCISIIRYLSEAGDRVPLDTHSRIVQKLNFPQLIVELLDNQCPWIDGSKYMFQPKYFFEHRQQNHFQVRSINRENGKNVKRY